MLISASLLLGVVLLVAGAIPPGAPHGVIVVLLALPSVSIAITGAWVALGEARNLVVAQIYRIELLVGILLCTGLLLTIAGEQFLRMFISA